MVMISRIIGFFGYLFLSTTLPVNILFIFCNDSLKLSSPDSVLYSIYALELMKFQNGIEDNDFSKQEKASVEDIINQMLSMNISFIEHKDLFFGWTSSNDESVIAMFRYKDDDKNYKSDEELARELGRAYVPPRS